MDHPPQSLNGLIATAFSLAANPPPFVPPSHQPPAPSTSASSAQPPPTSHDTTQDPAISALVLVECAHQLAASLSVISDNETLRDISTSSIRVLFLDSLKAELQLQVRTGRDFAARKQRIRSSLLSHTRFLARLVELNLLPSTTRSLILQQLASARLTSLLGDSAAGSLELLTLPSGAATLPPRELKIALFKLERALRQSLDEFRKAFAASKLSQRGVEKQPADPFYDLLLFSADETKRAGGGGGFSDDDEDQDEDGDGDSDSRDAAPTASDAKPRDLRQYLLLLLNYHGVKAASTAASSSQEMELLQNMPPPPPEGSAKDAQRSQQDAEWRLDGPLGGGAGRGWSGPLLDAKGKPLRPFTITSSSSSVASDRQQMKKDVFRPSHRLPTMTIDEYLEEEERRGNIITGGGHEGAAKATPREARALRAENDGTLEALEAEEEARNEAIRWDEFTEANRRGAGNTMNRG
ncbi:Type 2A phosphatase-associated protein 42 [Thecaphora frezii]